MRGLNPPEVSGVAGVGDAPPLVSVCVPTLHEEQQIASLLDHLAGLDGSFEVIVVDGGSRDATAQLARDDPSRPRVVVQAGGRAAQLNRAAASATGEILVFLHADSRLPPDAHATLTTAWSDPELVGGNFTLRFDGADRFSRLLGVIYGLQRRLGYYYGDSTLWVRQSTFAALGGFRELPIMDDYDFVRRLERLPGATAALPGPATTSSRRWQAIGIGRTLLSWWVIRWLYVAGVPAPRLARLYRAVR
ncbi:MAG TPA: TIGR04283 family arsenosugar biosynthesis glycosyltransferase [Solirubrobacteraceae bacterium]|jgi:rSAM/selenodomain-associated transferase 2|nr:TIGR04283 family arsenosugar biosynthesis glycosyltransferase [Solirubrobacteraceae bacterium]